MKWMLLFPLLLSACATPAESAARCKADADCRLEGDYCKGCDCRALGPGEKLPPCDGPGVRCIANPCMNKKAVCKAGACVVDSADPSRQGSASW